MHPSCIVPTKAPQANVQNALDRANLLTGVRNDIE
jgi:hypothetical protein